MSKTNQVLPESQAEDLRMAYHEVCTSYHAIDDFRAKLLGLLPLVSGVGIFFLLSDTLTDTSKRAFASQFLGPVGIFGCVVTIGLFFYELRGIQRCTRLIAVGKKIEGQLGIEGQFTHHPPQIAGVIGNTLAARVIYSAVLAAWMFVAWVFVWSQGAWLITLLVFFVAFAGSYAFNLSVKVEKRPGDHKELLQEEKPRSQGSENPSVTSVS